ncbi:hypothetical protein GCM10025865_00500 [Paraoerskovia sediminicola]|uniref:NAD(P)-binding domain-containing protein n=1 Tax=Paraoerskovia sediminicola TaxID=1138587 RepID=A0ABM8FYD1_9CELL|nr:hypothetical protein GCM10025865_00500 [Paraoerskovia sediminicola]
MTDGPGTESTTDTRTDTRTGSGAERPRPTVAVTGVTGYVGGRLVPELLAAGYPVRAVARNPARLEARAWHDDVEIVEADATDLDEIREALRGAEVAYYLIHSLGTGKKFEARDRRTALTFARAAREAGVRRIVYLGGLYPEGEDLSPHLESRKEVGEILLASGVPTTVLQAAVIIGSGSASFEMMRYLTERLPAMTTPRWVDNRIQPIAVRDVLRYLVGSASMPDDVSRAFDIGGPDVLTYRDMMQRYAEVAGLPRRFIVSVPVLTPRLSSHWVGVVTPVPAGIARPLVESLQHEVVCDENDIRKYVPDPPEGLLGFGHAVELALERIHDGEVTTRWSSASLPGAPSEPLPTDPDWAGGSLFVDERRTVVDAPPTPCGRSSRRSAGRAAGTPGRSPGGSAASWTASWAGPGSGADDATRRTCGWTTRWTSGASRRSSPAAGSCCAPRCACPGSRGSSCGWTTPPRRSRTPRTSRISGRRTSPTPLVPTRPTSPSGRCSTPTVWPGRRTGGRSSPSTASCSAGCSATSRRRRSAARATRSSAT